MDILSKCSKVFLKDLKNYINKAGLEGQLQVEENINQNNWESWDDQSNQSNITYIINTNPNTIIKIIGDGPQEMDWFEDPGFGFRLIRIYLDINPETGSKRYRTVMNNGLIVEYHIERPQDNNFEETSLSLDMAAYDIIKNIA